MTYRKLNQKGFGHLAVAFLVLAVIVIGFAGYAVMKAQPKAKPAETSNSKTSQVAQSSDIPKVIKNQADLNTVSQALDQTGTQLNSSFDTSALDASVDSML